MTTLRNEHGLSLWTFGSDVSSIRVNTSTYLISPDRWQMILEYASPRKNPTLHEQLYALCWSINYFDGNTHIAHVISPLIIRQDGTLNQARLPYGLVGPLTFLLDVVHAFQPHRPTLSLFEGLGELFQEHRLLENRQFLTSSFVKTYKIKIVLKHLLDDAFMEPIRAQATLTKALETIKDLSVDPMRIKEQQASVGICQFQQERYFAIPAMKYKRAKITLVVPSCPLQSAHYCGTVVTNVASIIRNIDTLVVGELLLGPTQTEEFPCRSNSLLQSAVECPEKTRVSATADLFHTETIERTELCADLVNKRTVLNYKYRRK